MKNEERNLQTIEIEVEVDKSVILPELNYHSVLRLATSNSQTCHLSFPFLASPCLFFPHDCHLPSLLVPVRRGVEVVKLHTIPPLRSIHPHGTNRGG